MKNIIIMSPSASLCGPYIQVVSGEGQPGQVADPKKTPQQVAQDFPPALADVLIFNRLELRKVSVGPDNKVSGIVVPVSCEVLRVADPMQLTAESKKKQKRPRPVSEERTNEESRFVLLPLSNMVNTEELVNDLEVACRNAEKMCERRRALVQLLDTMCS